MASVITISGTRSRSAWATPFATLAAPGPRVTTQAPRRPRALCIGGGHQRSRGLAVREHERDAGILGGADQVEVVPAARHAEQAVAAGVGQGASDRCRERAAARRRRPAQ